MQEMQQGKLTIITTMYYNINFEINDMNAKVKIIGVALLLVCIEDVHAQGLTQFQPIKHEYVSPIDLNALSKSMDRLESSHKKTIAEKNQIIGVILGSDMHPSEGKYLRECVNRIEQVVEDNSLYGNAGYAYDALQEEAVILMNENGFKGRIKANKLYNDFLLEINGDDNLTAEEKRYFIEQNPYYFDEDEYELTGIAWRPSLVPTKQ